MSNDPLNDDQRQAFLDGLPEDQVNPAAKETFEDAIARAAQPKQSKLETPAPSDDYTDTQAHSDTNAGTSDSHSDTSHQ